MTAKPRTVPQTLNLLNVWFAKPLSKAEILERIRSDQTITEPVRQPAFALGDRVVMSGTEG